VEEVRAEVGEWMRGAEGGGDEGRRRESKVIQDRVMCGCLQGVVEGAKVDVA